MRIEVDEHSKTISLEAEGAAEEVQLEFLIEELRKKNLAAGKWITTEGRSGVTIKSYEATP